MSERLIGSKQDMKEYIAHLKRVENILAIQVIMKAQDSHQAQTTSMVKLNQDLLAVRRLRDKLMQEYLLVQPELDGYLNHTLIPKQSTPAKTEGEKPI